MYKLVHTHTIRNSLALMQYILFKFLHNVKYVLNQERDIIIHVILKKNKTRLKIKYFCQRLNIVVDVSNALDYFHHHCQTPAIHYDLKSSNILFDAELIGHVGDFVLARVLSSAIQDSSHNQSSSIRIRGTIDYTPLGKYHCHFLYLIVFLFP